MRFGLMLSAQYLPGDRSPARINGVLEQVALAREYGFHSVFVVHHLAAPFQYLQPLQLLARIAADSGDMELGTAIWNLPFYHPIVAAEELTTLDIITRGKLIVGVGLGYRDEEFQRLGIPKQQRVTRFEEALALIKGVWTDPAVAERHGISTCPVRQPYPPLWIGGLQTPAIRRAARLGDAWIIPARMTKPDLVEKIAVYRDALKEFGSSPAREYPILRETFIRKGVNREEARRVALSFLGAKYDAYRAWGGLSFSSDDMERHADDSFILGDPDSCVKEIQSYAQMGVTQVIFRIEWHGMPDADVAESLRLLGEEVLPVFADGMQDSPKG